MSTERGIERLLETLKVCPDFHRAVASEMFNRPWQTITLEQRNRAKAIVMTAFYSGVIAEEALEDVRNLLSVTLSEDALQECI